MTCATLAAFSKYPQCAHAAGDGGEYSKHGFFAADAGLFREMASTVGLERVAGQPDAWRRHPLAWLLEAADDICYSVVDIEDGLREGHLQYREVEALLMPLVSDETKSSRRFQGLGGPEEKIEYLRARAINSLANEVFECFIDETSGWISESGREVRAPLEIIPSAGALANLKAVAKERLYYSRPVVEIATAGFEVLGGLLRTFVTAVNEVAEKGRSASTQHRMLLHLVPEQFVGRDRRPCADLYRRVLGITDFVSGMTDGYAVSLYKKITGISLPGR